MVESWYGVYWRCWVVAWRLGEEDSKEGREEDKENMSAKPLNR